MSQEEGQVVSVSEEGWAQILTRRKDACSGCGARHCCASLTDASHMVTRALNPVRAAAGDRVNVSLQSETVTKSAAIIYMIPLAGLVGGAILGVPLARNGLGLGETSVSIILGFIGLFLGFAVTAAISKRMSARGRLTPIITRVVARAPVSEISAMEVDPVCRMEVDPSRAPAGWEYRGKAYFFCNPACRDVFMKAPEKYLRSPV